MSAALAMADAPAVDARVATELLPVIQALMARHLDDRMDTPSEGLSPGPWEGR